MARLVWNQEGQNRYEYGVDRGVFYDSDNWGYVWNGLLSVEEAPVGGDPNAYHFDGIKYLDLASPRNYQAKLSAYTAPQQFALALGERPVIPGLVLTRQSRSLFGLSYRTGVGTPEGYKIHIVYNILASSEQQSRSTISDTVDVPPISWKIDAVPPVRPNYRPSAHYILDSITMDPDILEVLEEILYGSDTTHPRLPDLDELLDIAALWAPLLIMPQPDTGLSELVPEVGDLYRTKIDGINSALPHTRLIQSPIRGLYRLE